MDLRGIFRIVHIYMAKYFLFLEAHGTLFLKCIIHQDTEQVNKYLKTEIISCIILYHNGLRLLSPTSPRTCGEIKPSRTNWGRRPKRNQGGGGSLEPNDELKIPKSTESNDSSPWVWGWGTGNILCLQVRKSERSQINDLMIFLKSLEKERQAIC